jgi:hypothetical protein
MSVDAHAPTNTDRDADLTTAGPPDTFQEANQDTAANVEALNDVDTAGEDTGATTRVEDEEALAVATILVDMNRSPVPETWTHPDDEDELGGSVLSATMTEATREVHGCDTEMAPEEAEEEDEDTQEDAQG